MPKLFLHNSLSREREAFVPIDAGHVKMYVCGPTVYDLAHLGNARAFTVFDVLARLLRHLYPRLTYVRNITDVDDKIIERSATIGEGVGNLTTRTTLVFHEDMAAIGNLPPDAEPRATASIDDMLAMIRTLVEHGHAYEVAGHVLFDVRSFPGYGALSGRDPEALLAGARVEVAPYKRDPGDFVLWKPSAPDLPGWESPYGRGRPGWHIECSAMSHRALGADFDIHGGGMDLLFPHHENERAQSLCARPGSGFARVWVHNNMLTVNGQKMSKSLGNFTTVRDVLARARGEAVRLLLLRAQYRSVLDFSDAGLRECTRELDRFYRALAQFPPPEGDWQPDPGVIDALCDDLNTPSAIAAMHALADKAFAGDARSAGLLWRSGQLLGLLQNLPLVWLQGQADELIEDAIAKRAEAKRAREWARADAIRAELAATGIILEDGRAGTTWRRAD